ncbi:MAG: hypothetical protein LBJ38_01570 [Oscillospiraceae bacterium]|jgi:hypothetical protein|nr:hypothetical protein [Oscillospiraceae bacterium]
MKISKAKKLAIGLVMFLAAGLFFCDRALALSVLYAPLRDVAPGIKTAVLTDGRFLEVDAEGRIILPLELGVDASADFTLLVAPSGQGERRIAEWRRECESLAPGGEADELQAAITEAETQTTGISISTGTDPAAQHRFLSAAELRALGTGGVVTVEIPSHGQPRVRSGPPEDQPFVFPVWAAGQAVGRDGWRITKLPSGTNQYFQVHRAPDSIPFCVVEMPVSWPWEGVVTTRIVLVTMRAAN